jgi:hypothetical protein
MGAVSVTVPAVVAAAGIYFFDQSNSNAQVIYKSLHKFLLFSFIM